MKHFADFDVWVGTAASLPSAGEGRPGAPDADPAQAAGMPVSYPVQVFNSPAGPASGELSLDVASPEFQQRLVLACSETPRPNERQALGTQLFNALFAGSIRDVWSASRGRADAAPGVDGLRLRLWITAPELALLPWELLWDGNFLATAADLAVSRYLPVPEPPLLPPQDQMRVLLVTASPQLQGLHPIPDEKVSELETTINDIGPDVTCTVLRDATREQIHSALGDRYNVLHYLGHGQPGRLLLIGHGGKADPIDARSFAQLVYGRRELRMAVLNACGSGQATAASLFTAVGAALVQKSVPAVLAMQYPTTLLSTATAFSRSFYGVLAKGYPVDVAVNEARQFLSTSGLADRDWSTPVLYLGTRRDRIIELKTAGSCDHVADAWSAVRLAAETAVSAEAKQRALRSLAELSARFHGLALGIQRVAVLVNLSQILAAVATAYAPCRQALTRGGSILDQYQELKAGWGQIGGGPLNDLLAFIQAHPGAASESIGEMPTTARLIDHALEKRALKDLASGCQKFGTEIASAQATLWRKLKDGTDELVSQADRTLGRIDAAGL
jgi:hypothetical protein